MEKQRKRVAPRGDLRTMREAAGLSKIRAASSLGISRTHLLHVETGQRGVSADLEARMVALYAEEKPVDTGREQAGA